MNLTSFLDDTPVATPVFIAALIIIIIAYVTGDVGLDRVFEYLALAGVGSGAIGVARNGAGKGLKK